VLEWLPQNSPEGAQQAERLKLQYSSTQVL